MRNELTQFNQIIKGNLKPWVLSSKSDSEITFLYQKLGNSNFELSPNFELVFIKPLRIYRKFYEKLIFNETINYLNHFHSLIQKSINDLAKEYWVSTTLEQKIPKIFKDLNQIIISSDYSLDLLKPNPLRKTIYTRNEDEAFAMQCLKVHLVWLFLEIQESYGDFLKADKLNISEIFELYFNEICPDEVSIKPLAKSNLLNFEALKIEERKVEIFVPAKADVRDAKKGILQYNQIIRNQSRFYNFEEKLFENDFIDAKYNFKKKHGQINIFAAIFHHLINKRYFNEKTFGPTKTISPLEIRKFLDYRYASNTDKQFRGFASDKEECLNIIEKYRWIETLPSC